jgi:beta-1,4-mannosyltransferase
MPAVDALAYLGPTHEAAASPPRPHAASTSEVAVGVTLRQRRDRPAVLVSSTSWTEDEDFGILLEALISLDAAACARPDAFPDFLVLVTGKGPQKTFYEARMRELRLRRVAVRTLWLAPRDYPLLLGCADLGVCLHTSTSGLDLPMKVVDMFGAGAPVCAVNFSCLSELVKHDVNGLVFTNAHQLSEQLQALFEGFPGDPSLRLLERLRRGVRQFQAERWQDNWTKNAATLFDVAPAALSPQSGRGSPRDVVSTRTRLRRR